MHLRLALITLVCGLTALTMQGTTLSASNKVVRCAEQAKGLMMSGMDVPGEHIGKTLPQQPDSVVVIDIDDSWEEADSLALAADTLRNAASATDGALNKSAMNAADSLWMMTDSQWNAADSLWMKTDSQWMKTDSQWMKTDTSAIALQTADILSTTPTTKPQFIPNPQRALWLALLLPGAGQIYNRKYWKLPIFYGGFLGCVYAFTWNQQMYLDYSQAYLDIMDDDPSTKSYEAMLPYNYDIAGNTSRLQTLFKKKKDYYRRYRDLSAFCFVGVYLLSVIDAYVDAQLSEFSISEDLSLRVSPAVINNDTYINSHSYGLGCSLNF